jgi:hypothetical protein
MIECRVAPGSISFNRQEAMLATAIRASAPRFSEGSIAYGCRSRTVRPDDALDTLVFFGIGRRAMSMREQKSLWRHRSDFMLADDVEAG